ncbi:MAG TPA: alpha/beta hydrolase, partial [Ktedonobacteraceae bacterium]|nr:alpha/beta hydrolase [Ktedonobacteraceae bacterium]
TRRGHNVRSIMPFLATEHTTMYYDIFQPEFTKDSQNSYQPTVLLIHGFGGTPESDFAGQLPALRQRYRVIAPHLHGYGRSTHRDSYALTFYREDAADLVALLDALEIERVMALAFSDGAIVGLLLAALYPQRVQALAAMGAQPSINAENLSAIRHWLLEKPLHEDWQAELARLHGEPYWRSLPRLYVEGQEALVQAGGIIITGEELAAIRCPTLIMHGQHDRIVPAEYARILHEQVPGSELLLFDAGHAAHLRCEQEYTAAVMEFLDKHSVLVT